MGLDLTCRPDRAPLVKPGGADLHVRDMSATFSADVTLEHAQRLLAEHGQWLPVDGDPSLTLRELVEQNSTGPLRLGYGAWRDLLLGVQFTNGRGQLVTAGGRTVKNVAGYDLTKFMVGQHGIFGRIETLTTRTYRRPDGAILVRHAADVNVLPGLLPTDLRPQWAVLNAAGLLLGYLGDATTLDWYAGAAHAPRPVEVSRRTLAEDMEHRRQLWVHADDADTHLLRFRASLPPSRIPAFVAGVGNASWAADAAFGVVVGAMPPFPDTAATLRAAAARAGGTVSFRGRPGGPDTPPVFDCQSTNPAERQIIERLKKAFDPDGNLPPLPWQRR